MKVSIIIPCYNASAFVGRAISSVLAQTHPDKELICVDDHSTDGTFEVLKKLQAENSEIVILKTNGKGACAARNTGYECSTGEYLLFLDADDELKPGRISSDMKLVESSPSIVVGSYFRKTAASSSVMRVVKGNPFIRLFNGELGCTCSNLFNRDVFAAAGKWSEELDSSQEADLMLRVLSVSSNVIWNDEANTIVYTDSSVISKRDPVGNLRRYFDVRLKIYDKIAGEEKRDQAFIANAGYMFYGILHRMFRLDPVQAGEMHRIVRDKAIAIAEGPGVSSSYKRLYSLFGFTLTEKLFYSRK